MQATADSSPDDAVNAGWNPWRPSPGLIRGTGRYRSLPFRSARLPSLAIDKNMNSIGFDQTLSAPHEYSRLRG